MEQALETSAASPSPAPPLRRGAAQSTKALNGSILFWFAVMVVGQWLFLYYIAALYGRSVLVGDPSLWTRNTMLFKGYVAGDTFGNSMFALHALLAGYMAAGGVIQLVPRIRAVAPALHRWNGRLFLTTAILLSLSGFYMVWARGAFQTLHNAVAVSLNGVLIVLCAALAWRAVRRRDFNSHRRWALRAFLVSNGQWFIRIGVIAWVVINNGLGLARGFEGPLILPFVIFWEFGCYLVPLAVLEVYLRARQRGSPGARYAIAALLAMLTLLMALGIAILTTFLSSILAEP